MTVYEFALHYARGGWVPVRLNGKKPIDENWPELRPTEEDLREWFDGTTQTNIGILTGAASGIVVLDVDPRHGGNTSLTRLPVLPPTLAAQTGGGGLHFLFLYPPGGCRSRQVAPGLDLLSDGRQFVAAPSVHPESGNEYRWANDNPVHPLPDWLVERVERQPGEYKTETIQPGERHDKLLAWAGLMRRWGMATNEIEAALVAINAQRCVVPWGQEEIHTLAVSMDNYKPEAVVEEQDSKTSPSLISSSCTASALKHADIARPSAILGTGLITRGSLALLYGMPGKGKSWLTFQLAHCVGLGEPFFGLSTQRSNVGLFTLECPPWQVQERLKAISPDSDAGLDAVHIVCRENLTTALDLASNEHQEAIIGFCKERELALLIVDALSRAHQSDENDAKEMGAVMAAADRIRIEAECAVLLVHHERKPSNGHEGGDDLNALRGSTRLQSDPQTAIRLVEERGLFCLRVAKANWSPKVEPIWLRPSATGPFEVTGAPEGPATQAKSNLEEMRIFFASNPKEDFSSSEIQQVLGLSKSSGEAVGMDAIRGYLRQLVREKFIETQNHNKNQRYRYREVGVIPITIQKQAHERQGLDL